MTRAPRLMVTGAASGIGRAVVARAVADGAQVVAVDRDDERLEAAVHGTPAHPVVADVTDESAVDRCFSIAEEQLRGPVTALVHAAGRYEITPAESLPLRDWRVLLELNATGSFLVSREFGRRLIASRTPGSLVLLSSIAGEHGDDAEPAVHYSASKAAITAMARQLAVEWGRHAIRVNAVAPGLIRTPMLRITDDEARAHRYVHEMVPAGRLGEAEEVAAVCLFLAGTDASYVSGAVLTVDGGLTAR